MVGGSCGLRETTISDGGICRPGDLKSTLLVESKNIEGALLAALQAANLAPRNWKFLFNLGTTYLRNRQISEAENAFEAALKLSYQPRILMNLAAAKFQRNDYEGAKEIYTEILFRWPEHEEAQRNLRIVGDQIK